VPLAPADERAAAELLALAFHDQPLDRAVVRGGPRRRLRAARAGMRASLVAARGGADVRVARLDGPEGPGPPVGALVAVPPGLHPLAPPPPAEQLRVLLAQGPRTASRWREVWEALQAHHPREPTWYLSLVGVTPEHRGRGIGSALLTDWLARVDAAGRPAWLETAQEANLPLYHRLGFAVEEELRLLDVPVWLLRRTARQPGAGAPGG